ncbi:MAG: phosphoribosylamine--glycine ligase [Elusimicrobia bacterium]|nr:phosphoribosylamine--glycine ligase [Elusimicrobiota bacterium]MDE2509967.1 phosphoribosylamine--glycine ligase [Elusimicrobiota bacterium]
MKVLLLGGGGREHAIAWKLRQSPLLTRLWAAPGSDAIASLAERVPLDPLDPAAVAGFVTANRVELVFVGPEAPLLSGSSDAARAAGALVFGPSRDAARLETSKAFAKEFMGLHGVPTARARGCVNAREAKEAARGFGGHCAVKADGLAAGKGVIVCHSPAEAEAAVDELASTTAGRTLVIEERLEGPEVTVMGLVDGRGWAVLPLSQDHKRLGEGDSGPNTGGMGALSPLPLDGATWERIKTEVLDRTMDGLVKSGFDYRGALYAGVMLTKDGPKVLEYNCRFGDPETQAVLPLLDADLLMLAADCAAGTMAHRVLPVRAGACVGITMASPGYPAAPRLGEAVDLNGADALPDTLIFHAGTKKTASGWEATGGRVLTVVGCGSDLAVARERAYAAVRRLNAPGLLYRRDIAAKALGRVIA